MHIEFQNIINSTEFEIRYEEEKNCQIKALGMTRMQHNEIFQALAEELIPSSVLNHLIVHKTFF